ncbi:hypothetical protein H112_00902 [Trichophyton rubrum D6]|uniref:Fungal-type protein kinase domain-containing protein n=1 Tax=Trichophyton rubrum CBS 288.86 TaxID=1215330 RepID=A0A022WEI8_TRIRU|nr:hypothetical protein H100_00901 [Trichophyton rubrum MR850]EZF46200.1 hypothetical protein H102_00893 [Trichophyton rubrum CBS 100081]EZF56815.1 hypothetical protein H103_00900 [Trichophyton rubrum CBS 288.86]EZF67345.1 hypothetical protein H104_00885 [Trichophyton rubrum CBS 289.86]EZF88681.1 hypothetical protein H110_00901 [Trichophyton rubrum MR1448]EZF99468.1 hypothetical protein H113_00901 [Trichophyton rubrum MR1459]EZG20984.1 hypothetical protein H107_00951 [Trichophyton rubrum CBS 
MAPLVNPAFPSLELHKWTLLIPRELKNNPSYETQSRLNLGRICEGGIASERFDIREEGLRFVSAILESGTAEKSAWSLTRWSGVRSAFWASDDMLEDATHLDGDEFRATLVVKDSWQYPERDEEGELLREATEKGRVNVAEIYI